MDKNKYVIKLRIIEGRNLMLRDDGVEETPNPFIQVRICNKYIQDTKVQYGKLNANFDECILFDNIYLSKKEFEEGEILLRILHKGPFYRFGPDLIGEYAMNIPSVYQKPNHQVRDMWAPITRSTKAKVIFGYVQFDVMVIGEDDNMPAYDLDKQDNDQGGDDEEQEIDYDLLENLTLGQPKLDLKNHLLIISIYKGDSIVQSYRNSNIDPRIEVFFNGFLCKTDNGGNQSPDWKMSFEIPFKMPCLSDRINLRLYHKKFIGSKMLSFQYISLQNIMQNSLPATWINFYGIGDDLESNLDMIQGKNDNDKYQVDSMWNGRVLFSAYCKNANNPEYRKKTASEVRLPEETNYSVWFDIYEITQIVSNNIYGDIQVGTNRIPFYPGKTKNSKSYPRFVWEDKGRLPIVNVQFPKDEKQLPDIFINIYGDSGLLGGDARIAFLRLDTKNYLKKGSVVRVQWQQLTYINPNVDQSVKPFILFSLNFGFQNSFKNRPVRYSNRKGKYEVWCWIINSKNMPFATSKANNNSEIQITINGRPKKTKRVEGQISPFWNQIIKFRTRLPNKLELCSDILIQFIHYTNTGSDVICQFTINPFEIELSKSYRDPFPTPKWFYFLKNGKFNGGSLYCSFLMHKLKNLEKIPAPKLKLPKTKKCNLKICLIGTRKIENYFFLKVDKPKVYINMNSEFDKKQVEHCSTIGTRIGQVGDPHHNYLELFKSQIDMPEDGNYSPNLEIRVEDQRSFFQGGNQIVGACCINLQKYSPFSSDKQKEALQREFELFHEDPEERQREAVVEEENDNLKESLQIEDIQDILNNKTLKEKVRVVENIYDNIKLLNIDIGTSNYLFRDNIGFIKDEMDDQALRPFINEENVEKLLDWKMGENDFEAIDRAEMQGSYEQEYPSGDLPFETFILYKNFRSYERSGFIKMKIEITIDVPKTQLQLIQMQQNDNIDPDDMHLINFLEAYKENDTLECRIYLLNANNLKSVSYFDGICNPYVWFKTFEDDFEFKYDNKVYKNNLDPEIMYVIRLNTKLPDNNYIKIQFWDKDTKLGRDSMIGEAEIDIENRYYHPKYQKVIKYDVKNLLIEKMSLYNKYIQGPQGAVRFWLEILNGDQAGKYDITELPPPTVEKYEIRLVIWNTYDVYKTTRKVDIKIKCSIKDDIEGEINRETDTHMGSKDGFGEFNWRMIFRIILPSSSPRLVMGIFQRSLLGSDVAIGESIIDLSKLFREVHKAKSEKKLPRTQVPVVDKGDFRGKVDCELWIIPVNESELNPVGEERKEPNKDPFLPYPESGRSLLDFLPDINLGGLFGFFGMFKKFLTYACCGVVGVFFLYTQVMG